MTACYPIPPQITASSPNVSVGNRMQTRDGRGTDLALCSLVLRKRVCYAVGQGRIYWGGMGWQLPP